MPDKIIPCISRATSTGRFVTSRPRLVLCS
jgi:hypothetical protein